MSSDLIRERDKALKKARQWAREGNVAMAQSFLNHAANFWPVSQRQIDNVNKLLGQEELAEWGFDLTSISASNWKVLLKRIGARTKPMRHPKGWFIWEGKAVSITTANNPISGEYYDPALRGRDKGYASYIGITGEPDIVLLVVQFIKDYASGIKDESPGRREFI